MWKVIQCAVQGRGHIKDFTPCQDKTYRYSDDNITVTALADGAGSAKLSHLGAEYITEFICSDLKDNFDIYFNNEDGVAVKNELDTKIKHQITGLAKEIKCEPRDLASTLLAVAVKEGNYILLHIGDGVIGYTKDDELKVASQPENGEFVNTTIFTTSQEVLRTMRLMKGKLGKINGFILMSDGSEASLYDKKEKKIASALGRIIKMLTFLPEKKAEAQLTDGFYSVVRNATHDDCSISIMADCTDFLGYQMLDAKSRKQFLKINPDCKSASKQLMRYDKILTSLTTPSSLKTISKVIHLKPKYTKKYLSKLLEMNLIEKRNAVYHTIIIL